MGQEVIALLLILSYAVGRFRWGNLRTHLSWMGLELRGGQVDR